MAALLVAMTGCQKEPVGDNSLNTETKGYVALNINLPNAVTKADPTFNDGDDAKEYAVKTVHLVLYDNTGAYCTAKDVTIDGWTNNAEDHITSTGKTGAIEVENGNITQALVLINSPFAIGDYETAGTFDALNVELTKTAAALTDDATGFFMSNAPYYDGATVKSLYKIDVKKTEADALLAANANPAVKVERAVAKVTVDFGTGSFEKPGIGTAVLKKWELDMTNDKLFPVRKAQDWSTVNTGMQSSLGLIYWAEDPNYNTAFGAFNDSEFSRGPQTYLGSDDSFEYCLENTFDIERMTQTNTTRVMLQAEYTPAGTTLGSDKTWFWVGNAKEVVTIDQVSTKTGEDVATIKAAVSAGDCSSVTIGAKTLTEWYDGKNVTCFVDALCYYPVRIRHFKDTEIGYTPDFATEFSGTAYQAKELGRYGVLRNTWYKLTITGISEPGTPTPEDPENQLDDVVKQYVACNIDILAWGVREHNVEL